MTRRAARWKSSGVAALVLLLLCLAAGPAPAQTPGASPGTSDESVLASTRNLAIETSQRFPDLCFRRAHWVFAVDISGGMQKADGDRLDLARKLLGAWMRYPLHPDDRVSVIPFDDEVLEGSSVQIGADPAAAAASILTPLQIREGRKGTALQKAWETALAKAANTPEYLSVAILLSDRVHDEAVHGGEDPTTFRKRVSGRYAAALGASQEPASSAAEGPWAADQLAFRSPSGGRIQLPYLISGSRSPGGVPELTGTGRRRIPVVTPEMPSDPLGGVRLAPLFLAAGVLLALVVTGYRLWKEPAGSLMDLDNRNAPLNFPWRPFQQVSKGVYSGQNTSEFALRPPVSHTDEEQGPPPGGGDVQLLRAILENPEDRAPWTLRLQTQDRYQVSSDRMATDGAGERLVRIDWNDHLVLAPGVEYHVRVRQSGRGVGQGRLMFKQNEKARKLYRQAFALLVALTLLALALPAVYSFFPPPPGPQSWQSLCR